MLSKTPSLHAAASRDATGWPWRWKEISSESQTNSYPFLQALPSADLPYQTMLLGRACRVTWWVFTCSTGFLFLQDRSTRSYFWSTGSPERQRTEQLQEAFVHSKLDSAAIPRAAFFFGKLLYFNRNLKEDMQTIKKVFFFFSVDGNGVCQGQPSFMQCYQLHCSDLPCKHTSWQTSQVQRQQGEFTGVSRAWPRTGEIWPTRMILQLQEWSSNCVTSKGGKITPKCKHQRQTDRLEFSTSHYG